MVHDPVLARARTGDEQAFAELTAPHRRELHLHCYRIVGSVLDAEDLLQETLLAAWRGLPSFEGRASVRAWLYRIATSRCLNALRDSGRRPQEVPMDAPRELPVPSRRTEPVWLEPYPDVLLEDLADRSPGPEARYETREAIQLAFVEGLQGLPPLQRAALVLRDVLSFRTSEVADMLDTTDASVKGAVQRARATLDAGLPGRDRDRAPVPHSPRERRLTQGFADALERGDVDGIVALLTDGARLSMPPQGIEYHGHEAIAAFLRFRTGMETLRCVPTRANTQPAFGCYRPDPDAPIARPAVLVVLTLEGDSISGVTAFLDTGFFSLFGLPPSIGV